MWKKVMLWAGCAILILNAPRALIAEKTTEAVKAEEEISASAAVETWLAMVDGARYEESWEAASTYFKSMVSKEQWASKVAAVREPLGELVSRSLNAKQHQTALPGAPDGEYYVLSFNTVFANKAKAIETVTVMKDNDGQWRLAGYFIN